MADDPTSTTSNIQEPALKPTIRTVTAFLTLNPEHFDVSWASIFATEDLDAKIASCANLLRAMENELKSNGYEVQTLRISTNPFGEWMTKSKTHVDLHTRKKAKVAEPAFPGDALSRLERLDQLLANHKIDFCSVGPATNEEETKLCIDIVSQSHRFSCSTVVEAGNVESANLAADTILAISRLGKEPDAPKHIKDGLGNFRFCSASYCRPGIPFFPASRAESDNYGEQRQQPIKFAIGLENGHMAQQLLTECGSIRAIRSKFSESFAKSLLPIQDIAKKIAAVHDVTFLGIDSSLNPSLETTGSVAAAIENLEEVEVFGGSGTISAAAEITKALQSLPNVELTGYCGLMLPVCEDTRLAELVSGVADEKSRNRHLRVSDILSISSVCGVGVDTVPVPGNCTKEQLSSLILDVAGIAGRWNKSLSCRVFPVPGKKAGEKTSFDSPYMVNSNIMELV